MTRPSPRKLYVFRTVDDGLRLFPRRSRAPGDVVASAGSLSRWPHQLLGEQFVEAHLFSAIDENALRLVQQAVRLGRGQLYRPGLVEALPPLLQEAA